MWRWLRQRREKRKRILVYGSVHAPDESRDREPRTLWLEPVYPWASAVRWGVGAGILIGLMLASSGEIVASIGVGALFAGVLTVIIRFGGGEGDSGA